MLHNDDNILAWLSQLWVGFSSPSATSVHRDMLVFKASTLLSRLPGLHKQMTTAVNSSDWRRRGLRESQGVLACGHSQSTHSCQSAAVGRQLSLTEELMQTFGITKEAARGVSQFGKMWA